MEIRTYKKDEFPDMAALFVENYRRLRAAVSVLPDVMEDAGRVEGMLDSMMGDCPGVVALDGGKLVGYMSWFLVDRFRRTEHKGAYCPEWGHAAREGDKAKIYRAMYRQAANQWFDAGCSVHCLSLLACDREAEQVWFWNGFGLTVVDAIRPITPLNVPANGFHIHKATLDDIDTLCALEIEHARHYYEPPVQMVVYEAQTADTLAETINQPGNSLWLATEGDMPVGYVRFVSGNSDSTTVVLAPDCIAVTGAFVRPHYRGRGAAVALLDAGLKHYREQGYTRCSVDFESFNAEAAVFWTRYFEPVCLSVTRVPERQPQQG